MYTIEHINILQDTYINAQFVEQNNVENIK